MKVLFVTSRFPFPLEKGDKLRAYHFIKCLSKQHEVHLFATAESSPTLAQIKALEPYCKSITTASLSKIQIAINLLKAGFTNLPFQVSYFTFATAKKQLQELQQNIKADIAFFHLIRTAELAESVGNIPKVIDYMDTFSIGVKRRAAAENIFTKWLWNWEYKKLIHYEQQVFKLFSAHSIISEQDRNFLPIAEKQSIAVIPNGVETNWNKSATKKYDIIFAGNMNYPPNIEAVQFLAKKIMPLVWQKLPAAKVVIAGAEPAVQVQKLASENIEVTGWVSDIQAYFTTSKILVAPMLISIGLQNKLLEAMAAGVPCVTSEMANNALKAQDQTQILVAKNPEEFATNIVNLLENKELYHTISTEAFRFVTENYSWNKVEELLNELLKKQKT